MRSEFSGANTEAYLVDLDRILQDVLDEYHASETDQQYIDKLRRTIGKTAVCRNFDITLNVIGGRLLGPDSHVTNALGEIKRLYGNTAIRDGFLFGMAVNNKLLMGSESDGPSSPLNALDAHVTDVIQTIHSVTVAPNKMTKRFEKYAKMLFDNTLAHPNNPDAKFLNSDEDPFKWMILDICDSLYLDENLTTIEANKQYEQNRRSFQYGYAIARAGMNGYNLQIIGQLDQLFQDPAAAIDS